MKAVFHRDFLEVYTGDPAAAPGRLESILDAAADLVELIQPDPAAEEDLAAVHTADHIRWVKERGLHPIASLAAGGALLTAETGLSEPCFGIIRPPGHHASAGSAWGFCYYNNMAIALSALKRRGRIDTAYVLDFDLHFGDGADDILGGEDWVAVHNPGHPDREMYMQEIRDALQNCRVDLIGLSAGFDNHREDWGGLLTTDDYFRIGAVVREAADAAGGGCFALLEGGYNHEVLGLNAAALIKGLDKAS